MVMSSFEHDVSSAPAVSKAAAKNIVCFFIVVIVFKGSLFFVLKGITARFRVVVAVAHAARKNHRPVLKFDDLHRRFPVIFSFHFCVNA